MSIETLLLLAIFLLLPLIDQLVRAARKRAAAEPARAPAARVRVPPAESGPPRRPARFRAPVPATADGPPVPAVRAPSPRPGRRRLGHTLRSGMGLRRAIVLMTILGPCRAMERN